MKGEQFNGAAPRGQRTGSFVKEFIHSCAWALTVGVSLFKDLAVLRERITQYVTRDRPAHLHCDAAWVSRLHAGQLFPSPGKH